MDKKLQTLGRYTGRIIFYVSLAAFAVALVSANIDVVTRHVTTASLAWAQTLAVWATLFWCFFMAGKQITGGENIAVDIVNKRLKGLPKRAANIFNNLGIIIFAFLFSFGGFSYAWHLHKMGTGRLLGPIHVPFSIVIFIIMGFGGLIMFGYSVIALVRVIRTHDEIGEEGQTK